MENAIKRARRVAEAGARQSLEQLAVHHHKPWARPTPDQQKLRNRLRAHGRQLGDRLDERKGTQGIERLMNECAYAHWHRLLFARFLAENHLLIEPQTEMPLSLDECRELAREQSKDWIPLACEFAQKMLPQIFRTGDPVLEITLPPETRHELESILADLSQDVFLADDSLGWVYQFWQAEKKEQVNAAGNKIGADELPAVTQLFTEDYMVLFLLHNTLGAWWAGKVLAANSKLAVEAQDEVQLRKAVSLPGVNWEYLRFVQEDDGKGPWRPAAGTFEGWPKTARELRVLDPCMGSGHFLVAELPILTAMRVAEEGLAQQDACDAVLRENLFGLEIDPRCSQIAAFALAITAWKMGGYRSLPKLNLACSGIAPNAKRDDWLALAPEGNAKIVMGLLYDLFRQAPVLGSLIDPTNVAKGFLQDEFKGLLPVLYRALEKEGLDDAESEMAVAAKGIAQAAEILSQKFTLVATNVPYLGRGKQNEVLQDYCESVHPKAKIDLATCFIERCMEFCSSGGSSTLVTPQNWMFLASYKHFREELLNSTLWNVLVRLGEHGFDSPQAAGAFVSLSCMTRSRPTSQSKFMGFESSEESTPTEKATVIAGKTPIFIFQLKQLVNADTRIVLDPAYDATQRRLGEFVGVLQGSSTGDGEKFERNFWEVRDFKRWKWFLGASYFGLFSGRDAVLDWPDKSCELSTFDGARIQGLEALGKIGFAIAGSRNVCCGRYLGEFYNKALASVIPRKNEHTAALWAFFESGSFEVEVRKLDQKLMITPGTFSGVPFDLTHWQKVAAEKYPNGLPKPHSDDPTQWLFNGHPKGSDHPLQVAVARLLGYQWPRQTGSSFPDCPALGKDGLESHVDDDGIVCLIPLRGEMSAADRLRALLASAFGADWSPLKQSELLTAVDFEGKTLDDWLRDGFFTQHCALFHQRPFVWHIWDGLKDGFGALVNYHKLSAPGNEGRQTLEKLIYSYLGDWLDRQKADQSKGVEGSDAKVAAAEHLKKELEQILHGEPPYDIFVRWKPLHEQAMGWAPDINDGVRLNIRPFVTAKPLNARRGNACVLRVTPKIKWGKDRGKEPERARVDYPWFWGWDENTVDFQGGPKADGNRWNDLHYSINAKQAVRDRASNGGTS